LICARAIFMGKEAASHQSTTTVQAMCSDEKQVLL